MALTISGLMLVSNTGCFKIKDNKDKIDIKNNTSIEYVQNEKIILKLYIYLITIIMLK